MWLRDSLPKSFRQLRLWTYGYESNLLDPDYIGDIHEHAEDFRRHLRILRRKTKVGISSTYIRSANEFFLTKANQASMPIVFVVHSLGGLIFKEVRLS